MPRLDLDADAVANSGLGEKAPGDTVYATLKLTVLGDNTSVNGVRAEQIGPLSDVEPSDVKMVDLYSANDGTEEGDLEEEAVESPDEPGEEKESPSMFEETAGPSQEAMDAEENVLGYKRPPVKNLKVKKNLLF